MKLIRAIPLQVCASILTLAPMNSDAAEITAFVEPYRDIDVASAEMGTLTYIHVKEGDRVTKGQVIAGLDESVLLASLDVAQKAKDAQGRLNSAEAELALQIDRLKKIAELLERRHASAEELARAESQKRVAEAQVLAVREELEVKSAEYVRIEAQLDQKRIRAPIDGIVTRIFKDEGEFISASDPIVVKVVRLDALLVEFAIPAQAARDFKSNQKVPVHVGLERAETDGHIEYVSPTTDAQSNTVRVKIRIDNEQGRFQSGDSCSLAVTSTSDGNEAVLPGHFTKAKPKRNNLAQ